MADFAENLRDRYINSAAMSVEEQVRLTDDLRKTEGAPQYMIDRMEGILFCYHRDYQNGAQKLLNSFTATNDPKVFEEFFGAYRQIIGRVPDQVSEKVINLLLGVIDGLFKNDADPAEKAKFNVFLGVCMYFLKASLESKKTIAQKWLDVIDLEGIRTEIIECLSGPETQLDLSVIRFFPYALACAGLEEEVIRMNTVIAGRSNAENFPYEFPRLAAEDYANDNVFQITTDYFCDLLLNFDSFGDVLDIGCGPGRIGVKIRDRCRSLTGFELDAEYADFAENEQKYDKVIRGDAVTELHKLPRTFDFITSCMVLDYIPAPIVVREAAKLLNPGGHMAFAFIPALEEADNVLGHAYHYEREFYKKASPGLSVVKCVMEPYAWTGGFYVLLKRDASH